MTESMAYCPSWTQRSGCRDRQSRTVARSQMSATAPGFPRLGLVPEHATVVVISTATPFAWSDLGTSCLGRTSYGPKRT